MTDNVKLDLSRTEYVGIEFAGGAEKFLWEITCPCGTKATFALNELPTEDTMHPCGHPDHWSVRYRQA